jgi:transcriptional activator HAC1
MSTPNLKYEQSPAESLAESFTSTPGASYPPLFPPSMEPHQAMTPQSFDDDSMFGGSMNGSIAGTPAPEKKPVKKRKSWGQQLPEPKTNLPPRKRAKTEDEKEQRRVERVLRNRRAAQSSRERKRQEVEALESEKRMIERKNHDLELQLADMAAKYQMAVKQLEQVTGGNLPPAFRSSVTSPSNPVEQSHATSPSLTRGLFASEQDSIRPMMTPQAIRDTHNNMQSAMGTVDPASLSPPPMDSTEEAESNASSFDMTQHPAVSVERTTALDGFSSAEFGHYPSYGDYSLDTDGLVSYLDNPDTNGTDLQFFEDRVEPLADTFNNHFDHLAGDNIGAANDLIEFDDFIHQDEITQSAPEVQSSDSLTEKTPSLQPQFGASSYGCDIGGNAVVV